MIGRAQISRQEALDHLLAVDVVADAVLPGDGRRQELQHRSPGAAVRHLVQQAAEVVQGVVHVVGRGPGEAIAVVPLAHHRHRLVHVLVEHAAVAVDLQNAAHLPGREAHQLVELACAG